MYIYIYTYIYIYIYIYIPYIHIYIYILESSGRASRGLDSFWPQANTNSKISVSVVGSGGPLFLWRNIVGQPTGPLCIWITVHLYLFSVCSLWLSHFWCVPKQLLQTHVKMFPIKPRGCLSESSDRRSAQEESTPRFARPRPFLDPSRHKVTKHI